MIKQQEISELSFYKEQLQAKEDMLSRTTHYLMEIQHDLKQKNEAIAEINKDIFSSIQFASIIQKSLLPDAEVLKVFFTDACYKVMQQIGIGGDTVFIKNTGHGVVFGLFDSTGHGIPAAMLSISGLLMLNELTVSMEIDSPSALVKLLNYQLHNTFNGSQSIAHMEGSVFYFSSKTKKLSYCSAKGKCLYVPADGPLTDLPYTRYAVGEHAASEYIDYALNFKSGDKLILYSDGLIDQFGGVSDRKFTRSRFKQIIENNRHKPVDELRDIIDKAHVDWKNTNMQTDDVSFMILEF
ncbi:MAG: domain S-box [Bacteroidota bacterium]|jgi:serine phosphatase RsbU (regulator of sigma subunit)|nr:domain S-box [Bacteroidota bacterium]